MYEPLFDSMLVEIDDRDAEWGGGNDDSMLGKSYSKGKIARAGYVQFYKDRVLDFELQKVTQANLQKLVGKNVMWNEGVEAGTVFEFEGKQFGMIYWWDIRGVKVEA